MVYYVYWHQWKDKGNTPYYLEGKGTWEEVRYHLERAAYCHRKKRHNHSCSHIVGYHLAPIFVDHISPISSLTLASKLFDMKKRFLTHLSSLLLADSSRIKNKDCLVLIRSPNPRQFANYIPPSCLVNKVSSKYAIHPSAVELNRLPIPPPGYICRRCGIKGHFVEHCQEGNGPPLARLPHDKSGLSHYVSLNK